MQKGDINDIYTENINTKGDLKEVACAKQIL